MCYIIKYKIRFITHILLGTRPLCKFRIHIYDTLCKRGMQPDSKIKKMPFLFFRRFF